MTLFWVNIQSFKAFKMLNGSGTLRAKIVLNGSVDNVIYILPMY